MGNRFILQQSQNRPISWICTDLENGIMCMFDDKKFNETQKFTIVENAEMPDVQKLARIAREMGDWLRANHYGKIF